MPLLLHRGPHRPELRSPVDTPSFSDWIVVLPTKRRIRHLSRQVIARSGAVPALPFHTLESLARALFGALSDTPHIVSGAIQTLLFSAAIRNSAATLKYFRVRGREKQPFRGTFEKIIDVITSLKESGISPALLREESASGPPEEQPKLNDMAAVYEAYEEQLALLRADDVAGIYEFLAEKCTLPQFESAFRLLYPSVSAISLAGFDEFTRPEIGFINRICSVKGISVSLMFDFLPGNRGLFGHLHENYEMFRGLGFSPVRTLEEREDVAAGLPASPHQEHVRAAVRHIAGTLFNAEFQGARMDLSQHVTLLRARSREHEIEVICKLIKRLFVEDPRRDPSGICVAMVRPQVYTDIVREMFPRYGIPVNVTDRFELDRSPLVTALVTILQFPLNGYRREDMLRAARTPYAVIPSGRGSVDFQNLDEISRQLRIAAGYSVWLDRIRTLRGRLETDASASSDASGRGKMERDLRRLARAEADLQAIESLMRDITRDQTPRAFGKSLLHVIEMLDIPSLLVDGRLVREGDLMEKDVRAYARLREVLDDMIALLEFQDGTATTHSLRFYVDHLKIAVTKERYNIRERFGQGVLVTSIEETRGLPVDVMIVAGLVDGEFPSVYEPEVFFSLNRQKLREQRHSWQNRYLFYQAVTNWSSHLYLTHPAQDNDLELVRSSFIDALLKVARLEEFPVPDLLPWSSDICSANEYLQWYPTLAATSAEREAVPPSLRDALAEVKSSIAVEQSRLGTHAHTEYEGLIIGALSSPQKAKLEALRTQEISASQLETYGRCPYRFFAERVLRLSPVPPFEEDLTPLERGSLLHEALFEFFLKRREARKGALAGCSDAEFEQAVMDFTGIITSRLDALDVGGVFWALEKELILGRPGKSEGLVRAFLTSERQRPQGSTPSYFEVAFGSPARPSERSDPVLRIEGALQIGNLRLSGKIDRIDLGAGFFTVIDYKTGSVPSHRDLRDGLALQLPLYILATDQILRGTGEARPAGGLYYKLGTDAALSVGLGNAEFNSIAFESKARSGQLLPSHEELQKELDHARERAEGYVGGIAGGIFPLTTPDRIDRVCRGCDFKTMCRIQTFRHVRAESKEDT